MNTTDKNKSRKIALTVFACFISLALPGRCFDVSPFPFADSFEDHSTTIIGTNGWVAATNTYAMITNGSPSVGNEVWTSFSKRLPLHGTPHSKVVKLDTETGSVSNYFNTAPNPNVWIDMMVQPRQWSQDDPPAAGDSSIKAMFYFTTNGYLVNYCSMDIWGTGNTFVTNTFRQIASNEWVRLTVTWDYTEYGSASPDYYKIQIDGVTITNSVYAYANTSDGDLATLPCATGTWFAAANIVTPTPKLNSVQLSGIGFIDDFVVTNSQVAFGGGTWTVTVVGMPAWSSGSAVSPEGTFSVNDGDSLIITNTPATFWTNAYIVVNGITHSASGTYDLSPVGGNIVYTNFFAPIMAVSNTPQWWLSQYNLTNGGFTFDEAATNDTDADGFPNWFEYLSSTDPNDITKFFQLSHYNVNGTNYVKWFSDNIDSNLPPFSVRRSTNLVTQPFTNIYLYGNQITVSRSSTNVWAESIAPPAGVPVFYRIAAPNTP